MHYYNEHDAFAAAWLRELIAAGEIPPGVVDERSIVDVLPRDLDGFTQVHLFAGIGGWSRALRLAGWPDDRPVWTGSCPCQPFSTAGKGLGNADARHLWPEFRRLIAECRPSVVFGEQVASAAGRTWLGGVFADVEALAYRRAGADLCAAGVGAPHIRQRLFWVADSEYAIRRQVCIDRKDGCDRPNAGWPKAHGELGACGEVRRMEDPHCERREVFGLQLRARESRAAVSEAAGRSETSGMGHADQERSGGHGGTVSRTQGEAEWCLRSLSDSAQSSGSANSWSDLDWLPCADNKFRPTQPGLFPLAHGVPNRVGRLRGYGNAINPEVAAVFIDSYLDTLIEA